MICGDISAKNIFNQIIESSQGIEFLLASPPCQGMSVAGKNRHQDAMVEDDRNFLINYVFQAIELLHPRFVMIENVPALLKFQLPYKGKYCGVIEILNDKFGNDYKIEGRIVDASDYGVPQTRLRAIIKMYPYITVLGRGIFYDCCKEQCKRCYWRFTLFRSRRKL